MANEMKFLLVSMNHKRKAATLVADAAAAPTAAPAALVAQSLANTAY